MFFRIFSLSIYRELYLMAYIYLRYHCCAEPPSVHHGAVAGVQDGPDLGVGLLVATHPDGHLAFLESLEAPRDRTLQEITPWETERSERREDSVV